jgi:hypothetical protein
LSNKIILFPFNDHDIKRQKIIEHIRSQITFPLIKMYSTVLSSAKKNNFLETSIDNILNSLVRGEFALKKVLNKSDREEVIRLFPDHQMELMELVE